MYTACSPTACSGLPLGASRTVLAGAPESAGGRSSRIPPAPAVAERCGGHLSPPRSHGLAPATGSARAGARCQPGAPSRRLRRPLALSSSTAAPSGQGGRRAGRASVGARAPVADDGRATRSRERASTSAVAIPAARPLHPQTPDAALGAAIETSLLPRRLVVSSVRRSDGRARAHFRAAGRAQDPPTPRAPGRPAAGGPRRPSKCRGAALR